MNPGRLALLASIALTLAPLAADAAHGPGMGSPGPPPWAGMPGAGASVHGAAGNSGGARDAAPSTAAGGRKAQEHDLWKANRDQLDFDPHGHLVVRGEIVALAPAASTLAAATTSGFAVRREHALDGLDAALYVLTPPDGVSVKRALKRLKTADPAGVYDYNHVYLRTASATPASPAPVPAPGASGSAASRERGTLGRIGLIDGGVEVSHPALHGLAVRTHGCDGALRPSAHGTAVASLLLPETDDAAHSAPRFELYAADVYCDAGTGGAADAISEAIGWMVGQQVPVINVSLVGPPNALLERVVSLATERGHLIVAAVGNDGPAAPPLYPAAYPGVVAVTGVDRNNKVLLEAGRGPYVHFAAPGADVAAARVPEGSAAVRGTSFAAPVVAARLAAALARPDRAEATRVLRALEAEALDLGAPGFDPVYGYGCVGCSAPPSATAAARTH